MVQLAFITTGQKYHSNEGKQCSQLTPITAYIN